jgi:hypothetical protein
MKGQAGLHLQKSASEDSILEHMYAEEWSQPVRSRGQIPDPGNEGDAT